ncbi:hypothetical protein FOQG_15639 [Fusarium oxysporum f. sp. raphani 54005]|uniref:Uncharacterized protein n=1 Tax=Fusarium oxysporum f. sp. raphani 54005 TaxID=1089458 RepID=X0CAV3_FUSOX|nr:hypothetical protein FOQG_15639 [Fusarium oxysporum f. sp. raphani 54005]
MTLRSLSVLGDAGAESQTPDVAIWVVDGSDLLTWAASATKLAALLSSGELLPRERLVIAINKMGSVSWSEKRFKDAVHVFSVLNLNYRMYFQTRKSLPGQPVYLHNGLRDQK